MLHLHKYHTQLCLRLPVWYRTIHLHMDHRESFSDAAAVVAVADGPVCGTAIQTARTSSATEKYSVAIRNQWG